MIKLVIHFLCFCKRVNLLYTCLFCVHVDWPGVHVQSNCWHWCPDHAQGLCSSWLGCQRLPHHIFGFYEVCSPSRLYFFNIHLTLFLPLFFYLKGIVHKKGEIAIIYSPQVVVNLYEF